MIGVYFDEIGFFFTKNINVVSQNNFNQFNFHLQPIFFSSGDPQSNNKSENCYPRVRDLSEGIWLSHRLLPSMFSSTFPPKKVHRISCCSFYETIWSKRRTTRNHFFDVFETKFSSQQIAFEHNSLYFNMKRQICINKKLTLNKIFRLKLKLDEHRKCLITQLAFKTKYPNLLFKKKIKDNTS